MDGLTQQTKVLKLLKKRPKTGVANYEFPQNRILSYTKVISNLRKDGYNIITERVVVDGRFTGVYRYILIEDDPRDGMVFEDLPKSKWFTRARRWLK
jgi:hypothetical protein